MEKASNSVGALLIHGLGGTQFDLGSLHKILNRAGVETHALTLPGHGGDPADLLTVSAEDWIDAVQAKYREIVDQYETVHIMGMCMGSLLAAELAKRERHAKGRLVLLAPPVYLDGWSTPWYRHFRHLLYAIPYIAQRIRVEEEEPYGIKNELVRRIVKSRFAKGDSFHYQWVPLAVVRQVDRLRNWVRQSLEHIGCATLIVHAREDELTSIKSAYYLQKEMTGATVNVVILENSYHMICVDNDREQVAVCVLEHFMLDPAHARRADRQRSAL